MIEHCIKKTFCLTVATFLAIFIQSIAGADTPKKEKEKVAKTHEDLGKLLVAALNEENYSAVKQLMLPPDLIKKIGILKEKEDNLKRYTKYLEGIKNLAKQYRSFLKEEGLVPFRKVRFQEFKPGILATKKINGYTITYSTGVRILKKDGSIPYELIDQAMRIDDRWYILRLCTEGIERELKHK